MKALIKNKISDQPTWQLYLTLQIYTGLYYMSIITDQALKQIVPF